jgi:hypothetical protein
MTKKNKGMGFKTIEEYRAYYAVDKVRNKLNKSKYYKIGQDIARMACEKAVTELPKEHKR